MHCGSAKALECEHAVNSELVAYAASQAKQICPTLQESFFLLHFNDSFFLYHIHFFNVSYLYAFPDTWAGIETLSEHTTERLQVGLKLLVSFLKVVQR